jgi:hypothetical protein
MAVPRALFAAILRRIDRLRGPPPAGDVTRQNGAGAEANGELCAER